MQHSNRPALLTRSGFLLVTAVALALMGGAALLTTGGSEPSTEPSYASLRPLLDAGAAKRLDDGEYELFQLHSPLPTAWVWVQDSTSDGSGVEYWALHDDFVHPSQSDDDVSIRFVRRSGANSANLQDFIAWIVAHNPHVGSGSELRIHQQVVSTVQ